MTLGSHHITVVAPGFKLCQGEGMGSYTRLPWDQPVPVVGEQHGHVHDSEVQRPS